MDTDTGYNMRHGNFLKSRVLGHYDMTVKYIKIIKRTGYVDMSMHPYNKMQWLYA